MKLDTIKSDVPRSPSPSSTSTTSHPLRPRKSPQVSRRCDNFLNLRNHKFLAVSPGLCAGARAEKAYQRGLFEQQARDSSYFHAKIAPVGSNCWWRRVLNGAVVRHPLNLLDYPSGMLVSDSFSICRRDLGVGVGPASNLPPHHVEPSGPVNYKRVS